MRRRVTWNLWKVISCLVFSSLLGACAHPESNKPLKNHYPKTYQFDDWINARIEAPRKLEEDLIVLSFSGGGIRAAALADAVLDKLSELGLADKIAIISSTSGGSVTAGFVAAKGVEALPELRSQFLDHDNTADLTPRLLPSFLTGGNRSQEFAAYLDERLFGAPQTYEKLMQRWPGAPFVVLNASDTSTSRTFEFTQQTFNSLCSDLLQFSVSEAVAASAAFPFLMSAIPLKNHWNDKECRAGVNRRWAESIESKYSANDYSLRYEDLDTFVKYRHIHSLRYTYEEEDSRNVPYRRIQYVHLLDGGLSDNLAARALLHAFSDDVLKKLLLNGVRRVLLVQVNAKSDPVRGSVDGSSDVPSWIEVFKTTVFNPIDVATTLSSYISKQYWVALVSYVNADPSAPGTLMFYPVQVDFDQMPLDSKEQAKQQKDVKKIATWWSLPREEVDLVRRTGKELLEAHPCFQAFMRTTRPDWAARQRAPAECNEIVRVADRGGTRPPGPVPPPPPPAPAPTSEKVTFAADALFDFDKAVLRPDGRAKLDDLVSKLAGVSLEVIIAVGHTDRIGALVHNQKLSVARAQAVKDYLVSKGIEPNRIYTQGKGAANPVKQCPDLSPSDELNNRKQLVDCLQPNRRVEVEVVGVRRVGR